MCFCVDGRVDNCVDVNFDVLCIVYVGPLNYVTVLILVLIIDSTVDVNFDVLYTMLLCYYTTLCYCVDISVDMSFISCS